MFSNSEKIHNIEPELQEAFEKTHAEDSLKVGVKASSNGLVKELAEELIREHITYNRTQAYDLLILYITKATLMLLAQHNENLTFFRMKEESYS